MYHMSSYFSHGILHWLWLSTVVPVVWLLRRMIKEYARGFEKVAATYFEQGGRWTARKLLGAGLYLFGWVLRSRYYHTVAQEHRDFQIQGLRTRGPFVLDLDKIFIMLRLSPQSPEAFTSAIVSIRGKRDGFRVWDLLISDEAVFRCVAIIGPPGSGKTTLFRFIALTYARRNQGTYIMGAPGTVGERFWRRFSMTYARRIKRRYLKKAMTLIPFLLSLRDYVDRIIADPALGLYELVGAEYARLDSENFRNWITSELSRGNCLVMLDGLDEVGNDEQRRLVGCWIDRQMTAFPRARFLVTSRPFGYLSVPIEQIRMVAEVQPFSLADIDRFIQHWYLQIEIMRRLGRDDEGVRKQAALHAEDLSMRVRSHPALTSLAVNPLLLTMIALVHDNRGALPGRRVELYAEICDVMLGRRQIAKKLPSRLTAPQNQRVLQVLALALMEARIRTFSLETGGKLIQERLARVAGPGMPAELFLTQIESLSGLLSEREVGKYEFAHKSFQEYLAAVEIKDSVKEDELITHLEDAWWEETIRLVAVQSSGISNLFRHMLASATIQSLALAQDCVNEGAEVGEEYREELVRRVDAALESRDVGAGKLAAEVKLSQRIRHLNRIDDVRSIDTDFISCAEYQLFVDDGRTQNGKNLQPDHWVHQRFEPGEAIDPILGLRVTDAQDFCGWLQHKVSEEGITFRLPRPEEATLVPATRRDLGCWCELETEQMLVLEGEDRARQQIDYLKDGLPVGTLALVHSSASALLRLLAGKGDAAAHSYRFVLMVEDEFRRAQKRQENKESAMSLLRLRLQYIPLDGSRDRSLLGEIVNVFARARSHEKSRKLAEELERAFGIERGLRLSAHLRKLLERDLSRDLNKDLECVEEFCQRAAQINLPALLELREKQMLSELFAVVLVSCKRRDGNLATWEGLRIVREHGKKG